MTAQARWMTGLLAATVVLVLVYFAPERGPVRSIAPTPPVPADPHRIAVIYMDDEVWLEREKGGWWIVRPHRWRADEERVEKLLDTFRRFSLWNKITDKTDTDALYELSDRRVTVRVFGNNDQETLEWSFGKNSDVKNRLFARCSARSGVYAVDGLSRASLGYTWGHWMDARLFPFEADDPVIEAAGKGPRGAFHLRKDSAGWTLDGRRADSAAVETWTRALAEVRFLQWESPTPPASGHGPALRLRSARGRHWSVEMDTSPESSGNFTLRHSDLPGHLLLTGPNANVLFPTPAALQKYLGTWRPAD
jgi:hypothetical protein